MNVLHLSDSWQFKERDPALNFLDDFASSDGWLSASVPGTVHQDLLAAGRIPDPFIGLNEQDVQWVGERDWLYRCRFEVPETFLDANNQVDLCFDGLDTITTVWLNGQLVLISDNMFVPHRLPVHDRLRPGHNDLFILFESAFRHSLEREARHGARPAWNPNPSRLYVRKAQYHFGWDWGPVLVTAGVWRPACLESYQARIADIHCPAEVSADLSAASLPVSILIESPAQALPLTAQVIVYDRAGKAISQVSIEVKAGKAEHVFQVNQPQLWWPNGHGAQPLYTLAVSLYHGDQILDRREQRIGLRRLRLVQEPIENEPGRTFLFEVNNKPIFCGGANWIPADSLPPRVTAEKYRAWLKLAADAHMVMLRIWGGGIYEDDQFYDLCDELGLMVWQDFMFACGLYPADETFQTSISAEAEAAVRRLRHHPSLVLWCGNNEDYQIAEANHVYDPTFHADFSQTSFPARAIYEQLLPQICAALDPTRPYWPGSPYSGETRSSDQTIGDRHSWEIWHGPMFDYVDYPKWEARFVSEFGMQSYPAMREIERFAEPQERYIGSRTLDSHNKGGPGAIQRLTGYVALHMRQPTTLEDMVYATQFIQAEALAAAYSGWRRCWHGPGRYAVAGALVWQLNDCWPVISWALADYSLRPKPAYYVTRRQLAPITVSLAQTTAGYDVWAVNMDSEAIDVLLDVKVWSLDGRLLHAESRPAHLASNRATELGQLDGSASEPCVVAARLLRGENVLARASLWPDPFKYYEFPQPNLSLTHLDHDTLHLSTDVPVKGLWLSAEDSVVWSDNMIDLQPDDPQTIRVEGLRDQDLILRWLGKAPE